MPRASSDLLDPETAIREHPDLTEGERRTLLVEWNDTATVYPRDKCLHHLFEDQAGRTPDAVAVVLADGRDALTYRQLDARADRLASHLQALGVGAETLVGLGGDRTIGTLIGLLGILKAGGAYVPLPEAGPVERCGSIVRDAGLELLVVGSRGSEPPGIDRCRIVFSGDGPESAGPARPGCVRPENLACVIYTSGSTGEPKGVCVEHRGLINLMAHRVGRQFDPGHFRVAALMSPFNFDASITQILSPLITGGTLVIAGGVDELLGSPWYDRLTALTGASTALAGIVERRRLPASVRLVAVGGEPVPARLLECVTAHPTVERFDTLYGLTECSGYSTTATLLDRNSRESDGAPPSDRSRDLRLIGRPISNTRVYVLDEEMEPVAVGEPGELFIGGEGMARGFLHNPAESARRFVASPFGDGRRLYRTGDLARWRPDGQLEFLGRADRQVKLRGYRIELGEIEAALGLLPGVAGCAVALSEDRRGGPRLIAYYVPRQGTTPTAPDLSRCLRDRLPEYMVPSSFVAMSALPMTPNGKVDHRALPAPTQACREPAEGFDAPRTAVEAELAAIWADLLRVPSVGVHDNFFDLGGHSLLAFELLARIEQKFGRKPSLAAMSRRPTIEELAAELAEPQPESRDFHIVELQPGAPGRRPLFVLPTILGNTSYFLAVARYLGDEVPVYGLQGYASADIEAGYARFEDKAARCVEVLRGFQPKGPYDLFGYSYSGFLAYEVARQIWEAGETVDLLALIDVGPSQYASKRGPHNRLRTWLARGRNLPGWFRVAVLKAPPGTTFGRLARNLGRLWTRGEAPGWADLLGVDRMLVTPGILQTVDAAGRSVTAYRPGPYPGRLTLFQARVQELLCGADRDLGWGRLARGGVRVCRVSGPHGSMLQEPHVREIALVLKSALTGLRSTAPCRRVSTGGATPRNAEELGE